MSGEGGKGHGQWEVGVQVAEEREEGWRGDRVVEGSLPEKGGQRRRVVCDRPRGGARWESLW